MSWATPTIIISVTLAVLILIATMIRALGARKKAGEAIGWLDIALAFAQGIDDAKEHLDPDAKATMGSALRNAAEQAGKHDDVKAFLARFGFNQKP